MLPVSIRTTARIIVQSSSCSLRIDPRVERREKLGRDQCQRITTMKGRTHSLEKTSPTPRAWSTHDSTAKNRYILNLCVQILVNERLELKQKIPFVGSMDIQVHVYIVPIPQAHETSRLSFAPSRCRTLIDMMEFDGKKHSPRKRRRHDTGWVIDFMVERIHMQLPSGPHLQGMVD